MVYIIIKACPNQFLTVLSTHPTPILPRHHSRPFHYPLEYAQSAKNWNERNKQSINKSMTTKMADEYPERLLGQDEEGWLFYLAFLIFQVFEVFEWLLFEKKSFEFQFLPKSHSTLKFNFFGALRNLLEELQYQSRAFLLLFFQNVGWPRTSLELLEWKGMLKEVRKFNLFLVTYLFNNEWNYIELNISLSFHLFSTVYI